MVTITCGFNNTNDDRGIGDRSECSSVGIVGIILLVPKVPISFTSHVCYHLTNGKRVYLLERQGIIGERGERLVLVAEAGRGQPLPRFKAIFNYY
jgi:hypothetical protein